MQDGESFLIKSRTHVPAYSKMLQFVIVSFAPEFDGDILGTCAGTMKEYACRCMFYNCTGLTTAPELPATTLRNSCYENMFNGCTSLNYIKAMFLTTPSSSYTGNWTSNVSSTGTFVKNNSASWNVTGVNGIPENWTVETAIE